MGWVLKDAINFHLPDPAAIRGLSTDVSMRTRILTNPVNDGFRCASPTSNKENDNDIASLLVSLCAPSVIMHAERVFRLFYSIQLARCSLSPSSRGPNRLRQMTKHISTTSDLFFRARCQRWPFSARGWAGSASTDIPNMVAVPTVCSGVFGMCRYPFRRS